MDMAKAETPNQSVTIHSVIEGPFTPDDMEEFWDGPKGATCYLVVKLEHDEGVQDVEWYFETLDEAYEWVKHFKVSIDPIVIEGNTYG